MCGHKGRRDKIYSFFSVFANDLDANIVFTVLEGIGVSYRDNQV
ncbi:hypothetical protein DSUL_20428 [Desulfovibrionales bacterium]